MGRGGRARGKEGGGCVCVCVCMCVFAITACRLSLTPSGHQLNSSSEKREGRSIHAEIERRNADNSQTPKMEKTQRAKKQMWKNPRKGHCHVVSQGEHSAPRVREDEARTRADARAVWVVDRSRCARTPLRRRARERTRSEARRSTLLFSFFTARPVGVLCGCARERRGDNCGGA